jgi:hypothetical protein
VNLNVDTEAEEGSAGTHPTIIAYGSAGSGGSAARARRANGINELYFAAPVGFCSFSTSADCSAAGPIEAAVPRHSGGNEGAAMCGLSATFEGAQFLGCECIQ